MNQIDEQTTTQIEDLAEDDAAVRLDDEIDLHLTDTAGLARLRTSGTSTSPGSSDEDN